MSCVVRWWDVLFVKGMHFSSKNARLLNFNFYFLKQMQQFYIHFQHVEIIAIIKEKAFKTLHCHLKAE